LKAGQVMRNLEDLQQTMVRPEGCTTDLVRTSERA